MDGKPGRLCDLYCGGGCGSLDWGLSWTDRRSCAPNDFRLS